MRPIRRSTAILLLTVLAATGVGAQDERMVPRRALLLFQGAGDGSLGRNELVLLYETLLASFQPLAARVVMLEADGLQPPASDAARAVLARGVGADAWLAVTTARSGDAISVGARAVDLRTGRVVFEYQGSRPGLKGIERGYWQEIVDLMDRGFDALPQRAEGATAGMQDVVLRGAPGTTVTGLSADPLVLDAEGTAVVRLMQPGLYAFEATADGYAPRRDTLYVDQPVRDFELAQRRLPRWSVDLFSQNVSHFGVGGARLWGRLYARATLTNYSFGLFLRDEADAERAGPVGVPLTDVSLAAGVYLRDAGRPVRTYVEAAAVARIVHASGVWPRLEPIAPVAVRPAVGIETPAPRGLRGFLEYGPVLYIADQDLMKAAITGVRGADDSTYGGMIFGSGWTDRLTVDMVGFRFGLRWQR